MPLRAVCCSCCSILLCIEGATTLSLIIFACVRAWIGFSCTPHFRRLLTSNCHQVIIASRGVFPLSHLQLQPLESLEPFRRVGQLSRAAQNMWWGLWIAGEREATMAKNKADKSVRQWSGRAVGSSFPSCCGSSIPPPPPPASHSQKQLFRVLGRQ